MSRVLVLAPHTDDGELGCGATLSKYLREGKEVFYAAFSTCEDSLPADMAPGTLKKELYDAMFCLGVPQDHVIVFDYRVRNFSSQRQQILDDMIRLNNTIRPDTVFTPSTHDIHQDHNTIALECMRAFKKTSILAYEVPWNNLTFNNQCFSIVEECDVQKKINAVSCYRSQEDRDYLAPDFIRSLLVTHGVQVGGNYAEVFEVPRLILSNHFSLY